MQKFSSFPQKSYTPSHYVESTHIDIAGDWELEQNAQFILSKLSKLNVSNLIGAYRIHKHFELNTGECVVTTLAGSDLRATVQPYRETLIPWQWRYDCPTQTWIPLEFLDVSNISVETGEKLSKVFEAGQVLSKIFEILGEATCWRIGLCLNFKAFLEINISDEEMWHEATKEMEREQLTTIVPFEEPTTDNITTRWFQKEDGMCGSCWRSSCGSTYHHR